VEAQSSTKSNSSRALITTLQAAYRRAKSTTMNKVKAN
jgi:hypothetical protein